MPGLNGERLRSNLDAVRRRIDQACRRAGRDPASVRLVVVTKSIPSELLPLLGEFGVKDVGENRAVEGLERLGRLAGFRRHMIGHLQGNKVRKALEWMDVFHALDRPALLGDLARHNKKVPVFVQVNVSGEAAKGGFRPEEAPEAVAQARGSLEVLGLMTMAPLEGEARPHFRRLRELGARLGVDQFSMGMTRDFEEAVEEGATTVRIGSAIFEGVLV
jgi:hypothetical protein